MCFTRFSPYIKIISLNSINQQSFCFLWGRKWSFVHNLNECYVFKGLKGLWWRINTHPWKRNKIIYIHPVICTFLVTGQWQGYHTFLLFIIILASHYHLLSSSLLQIYLPFCTVTLIFHILICKFYFSSKQHSHCTTADTKALTYTYNLSQ
jgi:hypothetical protein